MVEPKTDLFVGPPIG